MVVSKFVVPFTSPLQRGHYSENPKPGTVRSEYGYFFNENIDISILDMSFFNMRKAEVERIDSQ